MNDRDLMENMLLLEKGVCDLYLHGSVESSTENVRTAFTNSLAKALSMQDKLYTKMEENGWYQSEKAEPQKLDSVKMKFSC